MPSPHAPYVPRTVGAILITATIVATLLGCASARDLAPAPTPPPTGPFTITLAPLIEASPASPGDCEPDRAAPPDQDSTVVCGIHAGEKTAYRIDNARAAKLHVSEVTTKKPGNPPSSQSWSVLLDFTPASASVLKDLTSHPGARHQLVLIVKGEALMAPEVQQPLLGGELAIYDDYTKAEAEALVSRLRGL